MISFLAAPLPQSHRALRDWIQNIKNLREFGDSVAKVRAFSVLFFLLILPSFVFADADSDFLRGEYFFERELYTAATAQFERFIQKYPDDIRHSVAALRIGKAHYFQQDYEIAEQQLEKLWREDRTTYFNRYIDDLFAYLIEAKIILGKVEEADQLTSMYALRFWYPKAYSDILFRIAEAWYQAGNYQRALHFLRKLDGQTVGRPDTGYITYLRAMIAIGEQKQPDAIGYFKELLTLPASLHNGPAETAMLKDQARLKLADLYFQQKKYFEASDYYADIENVKLWGDRRYLGLAWCNYMVLEYVDAIENAEKLVVEFPQSVYHGEAEFIQGACYLDLEDPAFAVDHFQKFVDLIADYETAEKIALVQKDIFTEEAKIKAVQVEAQELEKQLAALSDDNFGGYTAEILKKKERIAYLQRGIDLLYDRLVQRKVELQLKFEAEYGLNKAKLLVTKLK